MPETPSSHHRRPRHRVATLIAMLAVAGLVAACDGDALPGGTLPDVTLPDGGEGTQPPGQTDPPPEQTDPPPEQTDPPPEQTQPPQQTAPPTTAADDSGSGDSTTLLVLLILGLLAVIGAAVWMSSRKKGSAAAPVSSQVTDMMGRGRWLHDQASMELLRTSDPTQLAQSWQATSPAIVELEGWAASLAAGANDEAQATAFRNVQNSVAGLRGALQSDVSLRTDPTNANRHDLVQASAQTVQQRRAELDIALADPLLRT